MQEKKRRKSSEGKEHMDDTGKDSKKERAVTWQGKDSQGSGYGREELCRGHVQPTDGDKDSGDIQEPLA